MSRSRSPEAMAALRDRFLAGAAANGMIDETAGLVYGPVDRLFGVWFLQDPRRRLCPGRLPDALPQGPLSGGVFLCAAQPPADGVLLARRADRRRAAPRRRRPRSGHQPQPGRVYAGGGARKRRTVFLARHPLGVALCARAGGGAARAGRGTARPALSLPA